MVLEYHADHPINLLEIGLAKGVTSLDLIQNELVGQDFQYYGIDTCEGGRPKQQLLNHPRFHFIEGISFSDEVAAQVPDKLHWIFIDGCHCQHCVYRDAMTYIPRLNAGGMVCFHDACVDFQGIPQNYKTQEHDASEGVQVLKAIERLDQDKLWLEEWRRPAKKQEQGGVFTFRCWKLYKLIKRN